MSVSLSKVTSDLVGTPYTLGKMDCFMLIITYLRKKGIDIPEQYEGLTLNTYKDLFERDAQASKDIMIGFMDSILQPVMPRKAGPGDILLLKLRGRPKELPFLAINGGNSVVIFVIEEKGVVAFPLRYYSMLRGWTCRV